jgi:hypothetical protein
MPGSDWSPMVERLRFVVDGTNLFAFSGLLRALTATSISPTLAPALLANGGAMVRAKLGSADAEAKQSIRGFLAQLSALPTTDDAKLGTWLRHTTSVR